MQEYKLGEVKSVKQPQKEEVETTETVEVAKPKKQPQKEEVETTETVEVAKPKKVKIIKGEN